MKGWTSMGLPEPGPVSGARGVVGLLLLPLDLEDLLLRDEGLAIGTAFCLAPSDFSICNRMDQTQRLSTNYFS